MFIEWENDICCSVSGVNIWCIFVVDILRLMFIEWENDICFSVLEVNIWYIFVVDILGSMLLEWKKKLCSIGFISEICDCESVVENS